MLVTASAGIIRVGNRGPGPVSSFPIPDGRIGNRAGGPPGAAGRDISRSGYKARGRRGARLLELLHLPVTVHADSTGARFAP